MTMDEVAEMLKGLKDAMWQLFSFISDLRKQLTSNLGWYKLPIVNHELYAVNPYHYSIDQSVLNTAMQSIASTTGIGVNYMAQEELDKYTTRENLVNAFTHDAFAWEIHTRDIFLFNDIIKYWTENWFYDNYKIPTGFDPEYGLSKMEPGHLDYKYSDDGEWCDFKYTYLCLEEDTASRIESKFKRSFEFDGDMKIEYGVKHKKITGANVDTLFAGSYRHTKYSFKAHPYHRISGRVKVKWVTNIAR